MTGAIGFLGPLGAFVWWRPLLLQATSICWAQARPNLHVGTLAEEDNRWRWALNMFASLLWIWCWGNHGIHHPWGMFEPSTFCNLCCDIFYDVLVLFSFFCWQVAGKFPGYLSPSNKLLFADVPNGLAAITKASTYCNSTISYACWLLNVEHWVDPDIDILGLNIFFIIGCCCRCPLLGGFRSLATVRIVKSQLAMMRMWTSARLVTWDGTHPSSPETILRQRSADWMQSWQTDVWPWWLPLVCSFRRSFSQKEFYPDQTKKNLFRFSNGFDTNR